MESEFESLPEELLIHIFSMCDIPSLGKLSQTCSAFRVFIRWQPLIWKNRSRGLLCSNTFSPQMLLRSKPIWAYRTRCKVSRNWEKQIYRQTYVATYRKCMPFLSLNKDGLYCSIKRKIKSFYRGLNGHVAQESKLASVRNVSSSNYHDDDISKFVLNADEIVSADRKGRICRFNRETFDLIHSLNAHRCDVLCIDAKADVIVSGSRDRSIKIWRIFPHDTILEKKINMTIRALSTAIMPAMRCFIVGLPGTNGTHPLQLFDFEHNEPVTHFGDTFRRGAGLMDIYPECDNTFLCCGYDTTVKLWDIRIPRAPVAQWTDPYDNGIYCVQSDHHVTIVSGASRHGLVHIWDKRKPGEECIQQFLPAKFQTCLFDDLCNSPVYSVQFDASHLYIALDTAILQYSY